MTASSAASRFPRSAWGHGIATVSTATETNGLVLDTWYPSPELGMPPEATSIPDSISRHISEDLVREVKLEPVTNIIDFDTPPSSTSDAYLRLHLLSHLLVRPNTINLEGIFTHLPTVAWTSAGPVSAEALDRLRPVLRKNGIAIHGLDKFPRLLDYVTPERVRIADSARVRLGAHLSPGTTVMHEGFVNFNAGTLGTAMVEGRISQGVVICEGADIGGGASIMGTLSGGGAERITVGERALLGANAGIGISLGDDSVVEAGLYVTAGSKVALVGTNDGFGRPLTVKAATLSGKPNMLFRRNSLNGGIEAVARDGKHGIVLNEALHA